ncbi:MAG: hypothetical protein FAF05_05755 [Epsilonproteobacteria bacterium]|nr:hypothetical protein [Campylobacterota bacterium]
MILKLLLIIGVITTVYFLFIKKKPLQNTTEKRNDKPNDMIECSSCGVYVEISETILSNGKYYCSQECASKG